MKNLLEPIALPVIRYATRSYVAGDEVSDAALLARHARDNGYACTLCYWNDGKEDPEFVAAQYRAAIDAMHEAGLDGALAMKTPALWDRAELAASVVRYARDRKIRVMFDSHAPKQSDDIFRAIDLCGPEGVGLALPGRWQRSRMDAERAIELGLDVRIVKGQWADEPDIGYDILTGYMELAAILAGRARHVGVATNEAQLSEKAIRCMQAASTPCEQEVIYPAAREKVIAVAEKLKVASRLYIPFGSAWLPYSLSRAMARPQVLMWLMRDIFTPNRFKMPARNDAKPRGPAAVNFKQ